MILFYLLPGEPYRAIDPVTGSPIEEVEERVSLVEKIFTPFVGIPRYFINLRPLQVGLTSWILWLLAFALGWRCWRAPRRIGAFLKTAIFALLGFFYFSLHVMFFPFPAVSIETENSKGLFPKWLLFDPHSHTYFSHDGWATPEENSRWHLKHGFDSWAITDHEFSEEGWRRSQKAALIPEIIIPGEEFRAKAGNYLITFGTMSFAAYEREHGERKTIQKIREEGGEGAGTIVALWWYARKPEPATLAEWGVKGFEIINAGHMYWTTEDLKKIRATGLPEYGSTDYHGRTKLNHVWSLWSHEKKPIQAIFYGRKEIEGKWRTIFEPFVGLYYYFSGLRITEWLSWVFWILLISEVARRLRGSELWNWSKLYLLLGAGFFFLVSAGRFYLRWLEVSAVNRALLPLSAIFLLAGLIPLIFLFAQQRKLGYEN